MKTPALLSAALLVLVHVSAARADVNTVKVGQLARQINTLAVAIENKADQVNARFSVRKSIDFLAGRIRSNGGVIAINAARTNDASPNATAKNLANAIKTDAEGIQRFADALENEAKTAKDKASENLAKQIRRDAKDIKELAKDLLDELDD